MPRLYPETSRAAALARLLLLLATLGVWCFAYYRSLEPLRSAPRPPTIVAEEAGDVRFGVPLAERRRLFREFAQGEWIMRKYFIEINAWNGHAWSREDDRGYREQDLVRNWAELTKLSRTQLYLILDEGIHERWPTMEGVPLPATTPPLSLRPQ